MIRINIADKSFNGNQILKDINICIDKYEKLHIKGPSGIGKTTLLRILMGLDDEFNGNVDSNFKSMGVVFAERVFIGGISIYDEIKIFSKCSKNIIEEALKDLDLFYSKDKKAKEISTGMKSRASIIRAVLSDKEILFLDEPLLGLDNQTKQIVIDFIKNKTKKKTVVYTGEKIYDNDKEFYI